MLRRTSVLSLLILLATVIVTKANDDEYTYQRDIRQSPVFFQQRGPPQKGQQFSGGLVPKFVGFGGAPPQGFRPAPPPVDEEEEEEEIEKNSIAPSPSTPPQQQVLHFRQSHGPPQQQVCYWFRREERVFV